MLPNKPHMGGHIGGELQPKQINKKFIGTRVNPSNGGSEGSIDRLEMGLELTTFFGHIISRI